MPLAAKCASALGVHTSSVDSGCDHANFFVPDRKPLVVHSFPIQFNGFETGIAGPEYGWFPYFQDSVIY